MGAKTWIHKWNSDQFIHKEVTSYNIHNLENVLDDKAAQYNFSCWTIKNLIKLISNPEMADYHNSSIDVSLLQWYNLTVQVG